MAITVTRWAARAIVAVAFVTLVGCGDSIEPLPEAGQVPETTTAASSSAPAPPGGPPAPTAPACDSALFLDVLGRELGAVDVEVKECRNGYARVFSVPEQSPDCGAGGPCLETEQAFLGWDGATWQLLFYGTGITCENETNEEVRRVCEALGLPAAAADVDDGRPSGSLARTT